MGKWFSFPPRGTVRMHYTHDRGTGARRFILRIPHGRRDPDLFGAGWRQPRGVDNRVLTPGLDGAGTPQWVLWSAVDSAAGTAANIFPPRVLNWLARQGASSVDLSQGEITRRYFVPECPQDAVTIGINRNGLEVRESGPDRWRAIPGLTEETSWVGSERLLLAGELDHALRIRDAAQLRPLAQRITDEVSTNGLRLSPEDMTRMAVSLVAPGHRGLEPWTDDPERAQDVLEQEILLALMEPARRGNRSLSNAARRLIAAIPSLANGGPETPPPDAMAALAAVVGPLANAQLVCPAGHPERGWGQFFGGDETSHAVLDLRGLEPAPAARCIREECTRREGRVVTLIAADTRRPEDAPILEAWRTIAKERGIEAASLFEANTLADSPMTFLSFGQYREEPLDEATGVAMRLEVETFRENLNHWVYATEHGRAGIADQRDQLSKLTDYRAASHVSVAQLKIPRAQAAEARAAMRGFVARHGPVDSYVAARMGITAEELVVDADDRGWSSEQVDAIALAEAAHHDQGRAFIIADQTGTGKGRTAMGCARAWLNDSPAHKVIYLTVDKAVAVDGVLRDMVDTKILDSAGRPLVMASDVRPPEEIADGAAGVRQRREIFATNAFPEGRRFVISTYSSFAQARFDDEEKTDNQRAPGDWLRTVCADPQTMLVLDEAHTALNRQSTTGHNIRAAVAGAGRVLFVSATALRDGANVDLYRRAFPVEMPPEDFAGITKTLAQSDESELESFCASLIEDGVMLRRQHDSGEIIHTVGSPTDNERDTYETVMASLRTVAGHLLTVKQLINTRGDALMAGRGGHWSNAARINMVSGLGMTLDQIVTLTMASMTVGQTARIAQRNLRKGRKPVISMTRTNESYLSALLNGETRLTPGEEHRIGPQYVAGSDAARAAGTEPFAPRPLDARDYFLEVAARMLVVTPLVAGGRGGELREMRAARRDLLAEMRDGDHPALAQAWNQVVEAIEAMPPLAVSPFDALQRALQRNPDSAGRVPTLVELTGRSLHLTADGRITRLNKPGNHKQIAARKFNDGEADILVFSPESGGTGASYHASAKFRDQRPREYIQNGFATNILTFVQAGGRTCRFGQMATPGHTVVDTGTAPDRRAQQLHNAKLRRLGAINEGDRQHESLRGDVPDIVNRVGAAAAIRVLEALPDIRARMGEPNLAIPAAGEQFVRQITNAQVLLDADDNRRFCELWDFEYGQMIEQLNSEGRNPLETQKLRGDVTVTASSHFIEDPNSLMINRQDQRSALNRPVRLLTGDWHRPPGLRGGDVHDMAAENRARLEAARDSEGSGITPACQAARIAADLSARAGGGDGGTLGPSLPIVLQEARIGSVWTENDCTGGQKLAFNDHVGVIVDYRAPPPEMASMAMCHRFRMACPGRQGLETVTAHDLINKWKSAGGPDFDFGRAGPPPAEISRIFDALSVEGKQPVQLLVGSPFSVARAAGQVKATHYIRERALKPYLVTQRNGRGETFRAFVNTDPAALDLANTPFRITAASMHDAAKTVLTNPELIPHNPHAYQETRASRMDPDRMRSDFLLRLHIQNGSLQITGKALSRDSRREFWDRNTGPAIYAALTGETLPSPPPKRRPGQDGATPADPAQSRGCPTGRFRIGNRHDEERLRYVTALLDAHPMVQLLAPGDMRNWYGNHGCRAHAARQANWHPALEPTIPPVAALARTGNQDRPLLRSSWSNGAITLSALPPAGAARQDDQGFGISPISGWLLELPDFRSDTSTFWRTLPGRELWNLTAGRDLPDIAPAVIPDDLPKRSVIFDDPATAHRATELAVAAASALGARHEINRPDRAPAAERDTAPDLAA